MSFTGSCTKAIVSKAEAADCTEPEIIDAVVDRHFLVSVFSIGKPKTFVLIFSVLAVTS